MNYNFFNLLLLLMPFYPNMYGQERGKVAISAFEGAIVTGYVDKGLYLNFLGPNINFSKKDFKVVIGMLPSLRFKEDKSTPKNSPVTPNLGGGITFIYKKIALQVPLYYNAKTSSQNGRWTIGIGMGYKFK